MSIGTRECQKWSDRIIKKHKLINHYVESVYKRTARSAGYVEANNKLREMDSVFSFHDPSYQYRDYLYFGLGGSFSVAIEDSDIDIIAVLRAQACTIILDKSLEYSSFQKATYDVSNYVGAMRVKFPLTITRNDNDESIAKKSKAAVKRVCDVSWWRRVLRKIMFRQLEAGLRKYGFVRSGETKSAYVSNYILQRWKSKQKKNKEKLAEMEAVNELGESVNLGACVEASISNPSVMRCELMVRMRGYEEVANSLGLDGLFLTLTCPSKYHAQTHKGGMNKNFNGATPAQSMEYLNNVWQKIRAKWNRDGIRTFGFRVSEPHHDGTPHNHFLLFVNPDDCDRACEIYRTYAMEEDAHEAGADKYRCDVKKIDPSKGTAAGYIAKYVSKNMDGYAMEIDEESGLPAREGAVRAKCWASTWGIRQFQQIGSVSVTVWRELRRKREILTQCPDVIEELRSAADRGEWREFILLMGGAFVGRNELTARPQYMETEELSGFYGDGVVRLIGVWLQPVARRLGFFVSTRDHVWSIRTKLNNGGLGAASPPPLDLCQ